VDYEMREGDPWILSESELIPIEKISWDCLSIEAQGYGVIQKVKDLAIIGGQSKREFYKGFLKAYEKFLNKEKRKHEEFAKKLIANPDSIDW
jgi:hypothetical protein